MTQEVYVFYESVSDVGLARVTAIHYQPEKLTEAQKAKGVAVSIEPAPTLKAGYKAELIYNTLDNSTFYSTSVDEAYRLPYSDFMTMLPMSTRLALKENRSTDPIVDSFLDILESSRDDTASMGVNPVSGQMLEYYDHFVSAGYMDQSAVDTIIV